MATAVVEVSSTSVRAGLACGAASTPQILRPSACAQSGERPVSQGCIVDQPLWEATLHDTLTHLLGGEQGEWGERKLMLVQRPGAPRPGSARAAEFVFERCGLGHLRIVVDCGYDSSHVATVYEGYSRATTQYATELAAYRSRRRIAVPLMALNGRRDCYLSLLPMEILAHVALGEVTVALPDGRLVVVEEDAITGVESLFDPSVLGQRSHDDAANAQAQGLRPALHLSYTRSDLDLRTEMCKNVLLVGFADRVAVALREAVHPALRVQIVEEQNRHMLPWIGAALMAGTDNSQGTSRAEYEERGPAYVLQY
ncbi:actin subfamily protein [Acanthamoeba castellanii str. Neff]|uniref:Actin subfamily protein n=1 Tax=Acanthamoeba castellanii (strain ATCC 30010 / Neff) TaxID=1257118 RepID=L8H386_ACACF|nr:actin subfamily protein [Acanthamoeba castellanii str. Neff]ELR19173.1 actin subfamily protein [Acanthamoeba castellanii str. Neff]